MPESLRQYRERTLFMWDSLAPHGGLQTSDGLTQKVAPDGGFKPFFGDTVLFTLPKEMLDWLAETQGELYAACGAMLAERLPPRTFHLTLHDLLNSPEAMPEGTAANQRDALRAIAEARKQHPDPITVRGNCMFSMVATSVVMGFEPASDDDCAVLMELYERFQQIVPLSYPLTLHVTLAYYRPGYYGEEALLGLRETLQRIGGERREWHLSLHDLHYATFENMARYRLVPETGAQQGLCSGAGSAEKREKGGNQEHHNP